MVDIVVAVEASVVSVAAEAALVVAERAGDGDESLVERKCRSSRGCC